MPSRSFASPDGGALSRGRVDRLARPLVSVVVDTLDDHKADDTVVIDLDGKSDLADHMVIASGQSTRHVATLADKLIEALHGAGIRPVHAEGRAAADWVLIDAGDVVVHLFRPEVRAFYNLEKMWGFDAPLGADSWSA